MSDSSAATVRALQAILDAASTQSSARELLYVLIILAAGESTVSASYTPLAAATRLTTVTLRVAAAELEAANIATRAKVGLHHHGPVQWVLTLISFLSRQPWPTPIRRRCQNEADKLECVPGRQLPRDAFRTLQCTVQPPSDFRVSADSQKPTPPRRRYLMEPVEAD